jgi:hypothetical protein
MFASKKEVIMADAERSSGHRNDVLPLRPDGKTRYGSLDEYMEDAMKDVVKFFREFIMTGEGARGEVVQQSSTSRRG